MVLAQLSSRMNPIEEDEAVPNDLSEELCDRLGRNEPSLMTMRCPSSTNGISDANLMFLGRSLQSNTHLRSIRLQCFDPTNSNSTNAVTHEGVESLAQGICQSKVKYLVIDGACPVELQQPLFQGTQSSPALRVVTMHYTPVNTNALMDFLSFRQQPKATGHYLTDLALRHCVLEDHQKRTLSVALGSHQTIKNLCLHACGLTDDDLEHFVRHWDDASPVREFDLRGNLIGPRGAQLVMQAVRKHPQVLRFSLSENRRIGYEGLQLVAKELEHCKLEGICLCFTVTVENNPTPIAMRDSVCQALGEALRHNHSLNYLIFAGNGIYSNGALAFMQAIAGRPFLAQLILIGNDGIGYDGLQKIGEVLPHVRLEDLYLDSCVDMITKSSPTEMRLQACQSLASGLRQNRTLKELDLANNGLDAAGAQLLMQAIAHHPSLVKLSLSNNPNIGYHGLCLIAQEFPSLRLEELKLRGCATVGDAPPSKEIKALMAKAGHALIEGIKENVYLFDLNIEQTDLADACRNEIAFFLELNNSGRNLIHKSDTIAPTVWCHILANAEEDGHIYYFLREQPWLVRPTGIRAPKKRKTRDYVEEEEED